MSDEYNKPSLFNTLPLLQTYEKAINQNIICTITDLKGIIVYVNKKFCDVSKYSPDEVIGKNHNIINSGFHSKDFFKSMWQTIGKGDVWHNEVRNKTKDGKYYWVDTVIVPIMDENEKYTHYLSLRTLITDRKELEKKNSQYISSLETLNVQLEKYSYIISHDLKAPLQKISALTDLLLEEIKNGNTDELKNISNYIKQSIASAENIITETLDEAKNKRENSDELINIHELLDEIYQLIIIPKNFKFEVKCGFLFIPGKKINLLQVFSNIITNAIKYSDKPFCELCFECKEEGENFLFSFTDNGKGISAEKLKHVFQLFERDSDKSINSHGVGLNIVKSIVESRGGAIGITSKEGKETKVEFTWPKVSKNILSLTH